MNGGKKHRNGKKTKNGERNHAAMKKLLSILLALTMLLSLCVPAFAEETKAPVISAKDMSFYLNDLDDVKTYPVYFMGDSDVPYFSLADWAELMTYLMHTYIKKDQNISF